MSDAVPPPHVEPRPMDEVGSIASVEMSARGEQPVAHRLPPEAIDAPSRSESPSQLRRSTATDRRLLSTSSLTFASRVVARMAQLVFLVAVAHWLTLSEFATYSYLLVLAVTFSMLADTGVALAASREVSAGRRAPGEAFRSGLPVAVVGALLGAVTMLAFALAASGPGQTAALVVLAAAFVGVNLMSSYCMTMLRGVGRFATEAELQLVSAVAFVAVGVGAAASGFGLVTILAALVLKEAVFGLAAWRLLRPDLVTPSHLRRDWRPLLRIGIRMGVASTALAIASRSGLVILGNTAPAAEVAWYSAPSRIADAASVFALTAGYSLLPGLSHVIVSDETRAWRLVRRVVLVAAGLGISGGVVLSLCARPLLTTLFGDDFAPAVAPGRILLAGMPAYAVLGVVWYAVLAAGGERPLLVVAGLGAAGSVVAGVFVIPAGGDVAAAWVYVTTLGAMAGACLGILVVRARAGTGPGVPGDAEPVLA